MIVPIILSGGVGSRLWPLSREGFPKQFQALNCENSLFSETVKRIQGINDILPPIVVCNEEHRFLVAEQLRQLRFDVSGIILEPQGRDTAPAVTSAARLAVEMYENPVLLVLAADHVIADPEALSNAIDVALLHARKGAMMTFGIAPNAPETGFGYMKLGDALGNQVFHVERFVEKPNRELAEEYVESGEYCWNSGMFLFSASAFLKELNAHAPDVHSACEEAFDGLQHDGDFIRLEEAAFLASPSISLDYAVMERTRCAKVVRLECGWSDVGSWSALWDVSEKDAANNAVRGDVIVQESNGCYLRSETRLLAAVGIQDIIVVETPDAVLVAGKGEAQAVKRLVEQMKASERSEVELPSQVFRPWGSYESVAESDRFQVKRIVVNPGDKLSLQMHHHRAEHWIVVEGTAEVTCGDDVFLLGEDQSTYIPLGKTHRLSNPGVIPLVIIEVQSGSYLGEDDIVRFQDDYGRSQK